MILHIQQRQNWIRSRRQRRKLARRARIRRQILRYVVLVGLLAAGASAFKYLHWSISSVNPQVAVQGNQVVGVEQVQTAFGGVTGCPLYRIDPQVLANRVQRLEDVQHCFVRRFAIPRPTIIVQVMEEFPWASLAHSPEDTPLSVIAESGRVIPIAKFPQIIKPPFTIYASEGTSFNRAKVGKWSDVVAQVQAQTGNPVTFVDMRNPEDMRIMDSDLYLKIGGADSNLTRRLARLASIVPTLNELKDRVVYVDLSLENNIPVKVSEHSIVASRPGTGTALSSNSLERGGTPRRL